MGDRISFSSELLQFEELAVSYRDTANSLRFYYTAPSIETRGAKFIGYSDLEARDELRLRLEELDKSFVLSLLAALEGSFKVDYVSRCQERKKDPLSRWFRNIYKTKGDKVSFEKVILEGWKTHHPSTKSLISDLKGAFNYRHWLAHGRYAVRKYGGKYDFFSVYLLAQDIERNVLLLSPV